MFNGCEYSIKNVKHFTNIPLNGMAAGIIVDIYKNDELYIQYMPLDFPNNKEAYKELKLLELYNNYKITKFDISTINAFIEEFEIHKSFVSK